MFCAECRVEVAIGRGEHPLRIARTPLQHLHAAHRAAGDREQRGNAEVIEQHGLRAHHVANGDDGSRGPGGMPVLGLVDAGPVVPMQAPSTFGK